MCESNSALDDCAHDDSDHPMDSKSNAIMLCLIVDKICLHYKGREQLELHKQVKRLSRIFKESVAINDIHATVY